MDSLSMIAPLGERPLDVQPLDREEALALIGAVGRGGPSALLALFSAASGVRTRYAADGVDLCSIISARTGGCPEDCAYCAQSSRSAARIAPEPLLPLGSVIEAAERARDLGARRFCIVTSGRTPAPGDFDRILSMVSRVRDLGLLPCATLGMMDRGRLGALAGAGLVRYHHNLETSRRHFPSICSTHSYDDKLATIREVRAVGLSLCSGGIFGLGESWQDRVDMALELRALGADSIPINYLVPIEGTPLGGRPRLNPLEALTIVAIYRLLLPGREVRVCGGRPQVLGEFNSWVLAAGANGLLTGDYLTTHGRTPQDDHAMIEAWGLRAP